MFDLIKKLAAAGLLLVIILVCSVVAVVAEADAVEGDHRPCVTIPEYQAVKDNWRKSRVHEWFDTSGKFNARLPNLLSRTYTPCWETNGRVIVYYERNDKNSPYRVFDKDRPAS